MKRYRHYTKYLLFWYKNIVRFTSHWSSCSYHFRAWWTPRHWSHCSHDFVSTLSVDSHCPSFFLLFPERIISPKNEWTRFHPALLNIYQWLFLIKCREHLRWAQKHQHTFRRCPCLWCRSLPIVAVVWFRYPSLKYGKNNVYTTLYKLWANSVYALDQYYAFIWSTGRGPGHARLQLRYRWGHLVTGDWTRSDTHSHRKYFFKTMSLRSGQSPVTKCPHLYLNCRRAWP